MRIQADEPPPPPPSPDEYEMGGDMGYGFEPDEVLGRNAGMADLDVE